MASEKHKRISRKIEERTFIPDGTLLDACPEVSEERRRTVWQNLVRDKIANIATDAAAEEEASPTTIVVNQSIVNNAPPPLEKKLVDEKDLCERLGIKGSTVDRWLRKGKIHCQQTSVRAKGKKHGGKRMFELEQVYADLKKFRRNAAGD